MMITKNEKKNLSIKVYFCKLSLNVTYKKENRKIIIILVILRENIEKIVIITMTFK